MKMKQTDKDNSGFQFIEETVKEKKRNKRILRFAGTLCAVIFFAVIFGVVARYVFIVSDDFLYKYFGIEKDDGVKLDFNSGVTPPITGSKATPFPTNISAPPVSNTPVPSPNATPSPTAVVNPTNTEIPSPTNKTEATITITPEPDITPADGDKDNSNSKNDEKVPGYADILKDVGKLSASVKNSLVEVTAIQSSIDWFNDSFEARNSTSGIIIAISNTNVVIMTNYSDMKEADSIELMFSDGTITEGSMWNYDSDYDIAIINVPLRNLTDETIEKISPAKFGSSNALDIGTPVILVGKPNGYNGSVLVSMVSRKSGVCYIIDNIIELFQLDTQYNNLGRGFVMNFDGEIIGYMTHTLLENESDNVCTAVGVSRIYSIIEKLANNEKIIYFGVNATDIPKYVLNTIGTAYGIYVSNIAINSPAYVGEIKRGDIITKINGVNIVSVKSFSDIIASHKQGDAVSVSVLRMVKQSYREITLEVTLDIKINQIK